MQAVAARSRHHIACAIELSVGRTTPFLSSRAVNLNGVAFCTSRSLSNSAAATTATSSSSAAGASVAKPRGVLFRVLRGLGVAGVVGGVALAVQAERDEGTRRQLVFWRVVLPIYAHYLFVQYKVKGLDDEAQNEAYNKLHDKYAPVVRDAVLEQRGFYLKVSQIVSTADYFLPPQYLKWCKQMQDQAPTQLAPGEAEAIVEKSLGKPLRQVFSEFDPVPCGSASIGQVHRAKLRDTGEEVAVKVQAPNIERKFRADIKTIKDFCSFAMPQHVPAMKEIEEQFKTEFDYMGEAHNLIEVHDNVIPLFHEKVVIPKPFLNLCSHDVLVMEFLRGKPLVEGIKESMRAVAEKQGRSYEDLEKEHLEKIRLHKFQDIDDEQRKIKKYQHILDLRRSLVNFGTTIYNGTLGWLFGSIKYEEETHLLNLAEIIRTVAKVHGHEILLDGVFNCDPHPGNIMLLEDGRLGLIDLGQCKRLPQRERLAYAKILIALDNQDKEEVVKLLQSVGNISKYGNVDIQYRLAKFWHDSNSSEVFGNMNLQEFMEYCEGEDPVVSLNDHLIMPGRVSVLLRGMSNAFGIDLSMTKIWRPIAEQALERYKREGR